MKLKTRAEIQMGYSFRSGLYPEPGGQISVIQMKNLTSDNMVDCSGLVKISLYNVDEKHFVKKNDLIFRSRGQKNTSALVNREVVGVVLAAPLLRIRITSRDILPEYLNWYLSNPESRKWFALRREGTYGGMISKKTLEQTEIEIPPLSQQKTVLKMASLMSREKKILQRLLELQRQYNSQILIKMMKGE